jgi:PPM family protein phosphatase
VQLSGGVAARDTHSPRMLKRLSRWWQGREAGDEPAGTALTFAGWTDVGCKREQNQDAWRVQAAGGAASSPAGEGRAPGTGRLSGPGLAAVADGLGGAKAGDVASQRALALIAEALLVAPAAGSDPAEQLRQALHHAHAALTCEAAANEAYAGMGSTCSVLWWPEARLQQAWLGQVGDSRVYLWREGRLRQLTRDQTLVQRMIDEGKLTREGAERTTFRSMLEYALGAGGGEMVPQVEPVELRGGDLLLLCSDGLHGVVREQVLAQYLEKATKRGLERTCREFIAAARAAGGPDNITAVLVQVT